MATRCRSAPQRAAVGLRTLVRRRQITACTVTCKNAKAAISTSAVTPRARHPELGAGGGRLLRRRRLRDGCAAVTFAANTPSTAPLSRSQGRRVHVNGTPDGREQPHGARARSTQVHGRPHRAVGGVQLGHLRRHDHVTATLMAGGTAVGSKAVSFTLGGFNIYGRTDAAGGDAPECGLAGIIGATSRTGRHSLVSPLRGAGDTCLAARECSP